jgi:PAS domain-containing protein
MKAVESTSDAIEISDALGHQLFQNEAFSTLFDYETAEELEAAGGAQAVVSDPEVAREIFEAIRSGRPWAGELEMATKGGWVFLPMSAPTRSAILRAGSSASSASSRTSPSASRPKRHWRGSPSITTTSICTSTKPTQTP